MYGKGCTKLDFCYYRKANYIYESFDFTKNNLARPDLHALPLDATLILGDQGRVLRNDFASLLANHAVRFEETSDAPKERFVIPATQKLAIRN